MTLADAGPRQANTPDAVPATTPRMPSCGQCHSDVSLFFTGYLPAVFSPDGRGLLPPSASYTCTTCHRPDSHQVPHGWAPPRWHWYS